MRSRFALFVLWLIPALAACASPDIGFHGVAPVAVEIDGRRYNVYLEPGQRRPEVEILRMGYARRAEHAGILLAMPRAAEQASGCRLIAGTLRGDSGVMRGRLSCPDGVGSG